MGKILKIIDNSINMVFDAGFTGELSITNQQKKEGFYTEDVASEARSTNKGEHQMSISVLLSCPFGNLLKSDLDGTTLLLGHNWTIQYEATFNDVNGSTKRKAIMYVKDIIVKEQSTVEATTEAGNAKVGFGQFTISVRQIGNTLYVK